jgi:hypothetical protein
MLSNILLSLIAFPLLLIAFRDIALLLPQRPRFYIKGIISHFLLAIAVSYGLIFCICETLVGRDGLFGFWSACHFYTWMMVQVTGIKVVIEGAAHLQGRPIIIVMNHQT